MGDILLGCSASAGAVINGNLTIFLPVSITNRITNTASSYVDASIAADTGAGVTTSVPAQLAGPNSLAFNGLNITVPASGAVNIRITNVRGNVSQLGASLQPVQAYISSSGNSIAIRNNPVTVAFPARGLLSTYANSGIPCTGSPLPSTIDMAGLFAAGTRFFSLRVTEGFSGAFQVKDAASGTGTRFLVNYAGFPSGARLFVPDLIAGSSAAQPTAAGDLGGQQSPGQYMPGSGALLLARVQFADANGSGGAVITPVPTGTAPVALNSMSEVSLSNGAGYAVYEVVDTNNLVRQSAQIPTFLGLPPVAGGSAVLAQESVSFAPVSSVNVADAQAPVPRFAAVAPAADCQAMGDCDASFRPKLSITAPAIQFSAMVGGAAFEGPGYIPVQNPGGGVMSWTASVNYKSGSGWLTLDPASGYNYGSVRVWAHPEKLAAGTYEAAVIIDAGPYSGTAGIPVTLVVKPLSTTPAPPIQPAQFPVVISGVTNAASLQPGAVAPNSLVIVSGSGFSGKNVSVTFDGSPSTIFAAAATQLYVVVPAGVGSKGPAQLVVTVDGASSAAAAVPITPIAPAIFPGGVVNEDNTVNAQASPAPAGSTVSIFATGLPVEGGTVWAKIHDRDRLVPSFAGAATGLPGMQRVAVAVPGDLPAMDSEVRVCALDANGLPVCSAPVKITLGAKQ